MSTVQSQPQTQQQLKEQLDQWIFILKLDQQVKNNIIMSRSHNYNMGNASYKDIIYSELDQCFYLLRRQQFDSLIIVIDMKNLHLLINQPKYYKIQNKIKKIILYDQNLNNSRRKDTNRFDIYQFLSLKQYIGEKRLSRWKFYAALNYQDFKNVIKSFKDFQSLHLSQIGSQIRQKRDKLLQKYSKKYLIYSNFIILNQKDRSNLTAFILKVRKFILIPQKLVNEQYQKFKSSIQDYNSQHLDQQARNQFSIQLKQYEKIHKNELPGSLQFQKKILNFYSREGFYYKIANNSLRNYQSNYQTFQLHSSIASLYYLERHQLNTFHNNNDYYVIPDLTLYHGGKMSKTDFQSVQQNEYIMVSFFISTSKNRQIAQNYRSYHMEDGYMMKIKVNAGRYPSRYLQKYDHGFLQLNKIGKTQFTQKQHLFNCLNVFKVISICKQQRIIQVQFGVFDLLSKRQRMQLNQNEQSILSNLQYCYKDKDIIDVMESQINTRKQQVQLIQIVKKSIQNTNDQHQKIDLKQKLCNLFFKDGMVKQAQEEAIQTMLMIKNKSKNLINNQNKSEISTQQLQKQKQISTQLQKQMINNISQAIEASKNITIADNYILSQSFLEELFENINIQDYSHLWVQKWKVKLQIAKQQFKRNQIKNSQISLSQIIQVIQTKLNNYKQKFYQIQDQIQNGMQENQLTIKKKKYEESLQEHILSKINDIQNLYLQSIKLKLEIRQAQMTNQSIELLGKRYKQILREGIYKQIKRFSDRQFINSPSVIQKAQTAIHKVFSSKYYQDRIDTQNILESTLQQLKAQKTKIHSKMKKQIKETIINQLQIQRQNIIRKTQQIYQFQSQYYIDQYNRLLQGKIRNNVDQSSNQNIQSLYDKCLSKLQKATQFHQQNLQSFHPLVIGFKSSHNQLMLSYVKDENKQQKAIQKVIFNIQQFLCLKESDNLNKQDLIKNKKYIQYLWEHTQGARTYYNLGKATKLKGQYRKALQYCDLAQKICRKALTKNVTRNQRTMKMIQQIKKKQQNQIKALTQSQLDIHPLFIKIKFLKAKLYRKQKKVKNNNTHVVLLQKIFSKYVIDNHNNINIHKCSIQADIMEQKALNLIMKIQSYKYEDKSQYSRYIHMQNIENCKQLIKNFINLRETYLGTTNIRNGVSYCKIATNLLSCLQLQNKDIIDYIKYCQKQASIIFNKFNQTPNKWRFLKLQYEMHKVNKIENILYNQQQQILLSLQQLTQQVSKHFSKDHIIRLQLALQQQKSQSILIQNWRQKDILVQIETYLQQLQIEQFEEGCNQKVIIYQQIVQINKNVIIQIIKQAIQNENKIKSGNCFAQSAFLNRKYYNNKQKQIKNQLKICENIEQLILDKKYSWNVKSSILMANSSLSPNADQAKKQNKMKSLIL